MTTNEKVDAYLNAAANVLELQTVKEGDVDSPQAVAGVQSGLLIAIPLELPQIKATLKEKGRKRLPGNMWAIFNLKFTEKTNVNYSFSGHASCGF